MVAVFKKSIDCKEKSTLSGRLADTSQVSVAWRPPYFRRHEGIRISMSSISSVGTNSVNLFQWLSQIGQQPSATTQAANAVTTAQDPNAASVGQDPTVPTSGAGQASGHHHHHGFASKVESAVTTALQSAPSGSDPNQVIKDAITQALQAGKSGGKSGNDGDASDPSGAGGIAGTTATGTSSVNGSSNSNSFVQLLQSYGINAQQFQQDLQSALSSQQTGGSGGSGVDFATLFKSFPPGSMFQATG